jgi:hypothetical protein
VCVCVCVCLEECSGALSIASGHARAGVHNLGERVWAPALPRGGHRWVSGRVGDGVGGWVDV